MIEHFFELHKSILRQLFDPNESEILFPSHAKIVEFITTSGDVLTGIIVEKSIAIPITETKDTASTIKDIVAINVKTLSKDGQKVGPAQASSMLGLVFNGETGDFYSDSTDIGTVITLHIHPKNNLANQEEFLDKLGILLASKNIKVKVMEFSEFLDNTKG